MDRGDDADDRDAVKHRFLRSVIPPSGGGAVPIVSAITNNIGYPAGGGTTRRVITVNDSTGCTGATLGGVAMTSFLVDDATHVSGIPGAHAAGVVDVVVTNASGPSTTGTGLYEYWDPSTEGASFFVRPPNYALTAGGTWTATIGTNLNEATAFPDNSSGVPDFVRANADKLSNAVSFSTYSSTGSFTIACVADIDNITSVSAGTTYNNEGIVCDSSGNVGLFLFTDTGVPKFAVYKWDGSDKSARSTISASGRLVGIGKCDAGSMMSTVNGGGLWTTGHTGVGAMTTGTVRVGHNFGAIHIDGRVKVIVIDDVAWSTGTADKFHRWANAEHP